MLELAAAVDDDRIDSGLVRPDVMPTMLPPLLSNGPLPTPRLTPIESSEFCCPRPALYGGGAGVTAGLAVLGGGSGGSWAVLLRRYGLPYVALYRGSMLGAVIREVFIRLLDSEPIPLPMLGSPLSCRSSSRFRVRLRFPFGIWW
uniref:(northern house mosquito) hypothetical protein n=1 Tax=Culex pipiens TaxID=7175 RepID=A0A8D8P5J9_CULPI